MSVKIKNKKDCLFMRIIGFFYPAFMTDFWTTYRFPFQKDVTIACPIDIKNPENYFGIIEHEMIHAELFAKWYGPILIGLLYTILPLPIFFSGRWFIERNAYLQDVKRKRMPLDMAVDVLWNYYFYCWPKKLMTKWFEKNLNR